MTDFPGDDHATFADALTTRGVKWPLDGYAPGSYSAPCRKCGRRFIGDRRSIRCLPCAVTSAIDTGAEGRDAARQDGERRGYGKAIDDLRDAADRRYKVRIDVEVVPGDGVKAGRS